jgi:cytosine/adenosine deaminase-related metal-dependent hydrolase
MALTLTGTVVAFDGSGPPIADGAVYVNDAGVIAAVQEAAAPPPDGFGNARRVDTGGVIYPGLIDLHNHLAYNLRGLWAPPHTKPYTTRYQWPKAKTYDADIRAPTQLLWQLAPEEALKYVEAKAVAGGVTTIQGLSSETTPREGWLIRHVERETFDNGKKVAHQSVRKLGAAADFAAARGELQQGSAFLYHLAEGTATNLIKEFNDLAGNGCLLPGLIGIHSTALRAAQFQQWGTQRGTIVWSPLSNLWLYHSTSDVLAARQAGMRICLGSDWGPSGSKNLLGELKVADLWNREQLSDGFSDRELCEMATTNPADALALAGHVGRLRPGLRADLLVLAAHRPDPYRNLIECTEAHTALVLVRGRPVYGTAALMSAAGAANVQNVTVAATAHAISLPDPAVPAAKLRWSDIVGRLETVQSNPGAAHDELADGLRATEPFRVELDMPWDEPTFAARAKPVAPADVTIPPLDPLAPDDAFFDALKQATILGGLLKDLRNYY